MSDERIHVPIGGSGDYASEGGAPSSLTDLTDVSGDPGERKAPVYDDAGTAHLTEVPTQDDIDGILVRVARVDWHNIGADGEPPFLSGFRNLGDPWGHARYRHSANNIVHLEGCVSNDDASLAGATWVPIFQFPPEAAPGASLRFLGMANDHSIAAIVVWEDGLVVFAGWVVGPTAPIDYISLAGVSFSVGVA